MARYIKIVRKVDSICLFSGVWRLKPINPADLDAWKDQRGMRGGVTSEGSVALPEPSPGERQLAPLGGCSGFRTGVHTS